MNLLHDSLEKSGYGADLVSISYLSQILVKTNLLYQNGLRASVPNIMPHLVQNVMAYLDAHLLESVSLQTLSSLFYHNGTYISRCFKKATGLSVQQYILMKRINLALRYLEQGCSVTNACTASGFNNYSNFSRTFSRQVGMSPRLYQAQFQHLHRLS